MRIRVWVRDQNPCPRAQSVSNSWLSKEKEHLLLAPSKESFSSLAWIAAGDPEVKPLPRVLVENQGTRAQNLEIT